MGKLVGEAVTGGLEVFDRLGDEWREMLDRVEDDSPYWRPEWIQAALRAYLTQLFAATPPMTYQPEAVWPIEGGFCGRWYCTIGQGEGAGRMRGFDLVLLDGERIRLNEVYVHQLPA